ncbi:MAG: hypothetical protein ACTSYI_14025 [Promethearchaeota archaeon]
MDLNIHDKILPKGRPWVLYNAEKAEKAEKTKETEKTKAINQESKEEL